MKGRKLLKSLLFIMCFIIGIEVNAATNDANVIGRIYTDTYAIQQYKTGGTRIFEAVAYHLIKDNLQHVGYCIQIGQPFTETVYSSTSDYTLVGLNKEKADYVRLVAYYGYSYNNSHQNYKYFLAAQELIWEKLYEDEFYWTVGASAQGTRINVDAEKKEISKLIENHNIKPKFDVSTINCGQTIEIEDKNNVFSDYKITNVENATYAVSGNKIKITAINLNDIVINYERKLTKNYPNTEMFYYANNSQRIASTGLIEAPSGKIVIPNNGVKIKINKKSRETSELINEKGIGFKIYDISNQKYVCLDNGVCEISTNEEGIAIFPNLKSGNYKLEELDKKIDGYLYNPESVEFTVNQNNVIYNAEYGKIIEVDYYNQQPTGSLIINKKGQTMVINDNKFSYESIALENIEFNVITNQDIFYNEIKFRKGDTIATIKTNEDGIAKLDNLPLGSYTVKETSIIPLYEANDTEYNIEFKYKDQYTSVITEQIDVENILKKGELKFRKIDGYTKEGLAGVVIAIYDELGNKIYEGTTDANGNIYLNNLAYGNYYLKELNALDGYYQDNNSIDFSINEEKNIVEITMKNDKIEKPPKTSLSSVNSNSTLQLIISSIVSIITLAIIYCTTKLKCMV